MSAPHDPVSVLRDALDLAGCEPIGSAVSFQARCPAHRGEGRSLSVTEGSDRRALLHCFAHQCDPSAVVEALGLRMADLFPTGHRKGPRNPFKVAARSDLEGRSQTMANVLHALDRSGLPWEAMISCACPYCDSPGAWFRTSPKGTRVDCPDGCGEREFVGALAARAETVR